MAKRSQALIGTDRECAAVALPPPGRLVAEYRIKNCPGLVLRVTGKGRRSWVLWLKQLATGKWRKLLLGAYPAVTLAKARAAALRHKADAISGVDPFAARSASKGVLNVRELGDLFIRRYARPQKRTWRDDQRQLEHDIYPTLGDWRCDHVKKTDLVRVLDRIADRGAGVQANRTRALVSKLFAWAVSEGYLDQSPATRIAARVKETPRARALDEGEIVVFWNWLEQSTIDIATRDVLRLLLLLGARVSEVTGMQRDELVFNGPGVLWTLPAPRAKANSDILRPLAPMARRIVERRLNATNSPFVFASPTDPSKPLLRYAPLQAIRRAAERGLVPAGFTVHDLRRTLVTQLAALGVPEQVMRKLLGHRASRDDITASVYNRHNYLVEMHHALARWERRLTQMLKAKPVAGMQQTLARQ